MKHFVAYLFASVLLASAGSASAHLHPTRHFKPRVMPVVVWVSAQGQVTDISPSEELRDSTRALLMDQMQSWVTAPARINNQPVSSRFIIDVAVKAQLRADGRYSMHFVYLKSLAMPFAGAFYWHHFNSGREVALVADHRPPNAQSRWIMRCEANGCPLEGGCNFRDRALRSGHGMSAIRTLNAPVVPLTQPIVQPPIFQQRVVIRSWRTRETVPRSRRTH